VSAKNLDTKKSTIYKSVGTTTMFRVYNARTESPHIVNASAPKTDRLLCTPGVASRLHTPFAERLRPFLVPLVGFEPVTTVTHNREGRQDLWVCTVDGAPNDVKVYTFGPGRDAHQYSNLFISQESFRTLVNSGYIK